jgi:multiple sugar transport system permease protein
MALTVMVHMLPPIATVIPLYILLRKVGLLNQLSGLILVYAALSVTYVVWVMSGYFQTIPKELEESARIDGCSRMGALMRVILPIVTPGLIATGILVFITTWNEFLYVLVLINDPANKTVPVMIAEFSTQDQIKYGMIMTGGIIVSLPPVLLALIFQRRLISGLTAGAVKG